MLMYRDNNNKSVLNKDKCEPTEFDRNEQSKVLIDRNEQSQYVDFIKRKYPDIYLDRLVYR